MNRAAHSFFAAFAGWLIPFLGLMVGLKLANGRIMDFGFWLSWPLLFTALGWLVVGLPIALSFSTDALPKLRKVILIATAATTVTFISFALLSQIASLILWLLWWPVLIGVIGGSIYWALQRTQPLRGWVFWVTPLIFFPLVRYVVLPIGIAFFPYSTHVLAEGAIGREAEIEIVKRVKVGDTYQELHRRYPRMFERRSSMSNGIWAISGGDWLVHIEFDDEERVTSVEITSEPNSEQDGGGPPATRSKSKVTRDYDP